MNTNLFRKNFITTQDWTIVTLHAPAKPDTRHLLNAERLVLMKDMALLINTARGALIDEAALIAELSRGSFLCFPGRHRPRTTSS